MKAEDVIKANSLIDRLNNIKAEISWIERNGADVRVCDHDNFGKQIYYSGSDDAEKIKKFIISMKNSEMQLILGRLTEMGVEIAREAK